ncbi:hypothetical protein FIA58_003095 [Flavobacterium jejuense]|uniref:Uncharacterized protein n=1 Tax=Flavobacterium jejuense TaxID=1544455 RepID=A0ABX0ILH3_9FLAO|nr:hypothetical protein [Flavobacterium jejuense]NHN24652.1 hypothetical protein [Flavobacterium jejuense]
MKKIIFPFCLLFALGCKVDHPKPESNLAQIQDSVYNIQSVYGPNLASKPYELKLNTHQLSNGNYDLEIQMLLYNNAYYASSNTKKSLKGKFTFFMDDTNFFTLKSNLVETPLTIREPNSETADNGMTDWIRVNTHYKQQLEITTTEDFAVGGYIQFTIEPRCTLEKIPVIIKRKNGILKFEIDNC